MPRAVLILVLLSAAVRGELVETAPLPNRWMPQGEFRLYSEPHETRIEIVLHTRFLDRVLNAIAEKEKANWGPDHPEARQYLELLANARQRLEPVARFGARASLVIEFSDASTGGVIRISSARVTEVDGHLQVEQPVELASFAPSQAYLRRNMALILADRLDVSMETAEQRLSGATR